MFAVDGLWAPWVMAVMWSFAYLAASRSWGLPRVFGRTVVGGMEMWNSYTGQ
jgi:hypothetical protein